MYKGPILKILKKKVGVKKTYTIAEDNDPTGYKSSKGKEAKRKVGIKPIEWPRYSPDLMPLDFSLWEDVLLGIIVECPPRGGEGSRGGWWVCGWGG